MAGLDYGTAISLLAVTALVATAYSWIKSLFFSPLSKFKGPLVAGCSEWYKTWGECYVQWSFSHKLVELHAQYGDVVRVAPNELHFSKPQAYLDIYNSQNRWDKDPKLYHAMNEDESSFGFITYKEAKPRKDALSKLFSSKEILQTQDLVQERIDGLCDVMTQLSAQGNSIDLNKAFRSMTVDIITYLCFGKSIDAMHAKDFEAPIITAMTAAMPGFKWFKYFPLYMKVILSTPPEIAKKIAPPSSGLIDLQQTLLTQIEEIRRNPKQTLDALPHRMTIYHHLINTDKEATVPSAKSIFQETQVMMFAGSDTVAHTLMHGFFELLGNPSCYNKLKDEIKSAWPELGGQQPSLQVLERLPYLNAVIKESLRLSCGVTSGLLRIVPQDGAEIAGVFVPGGTSVSCAAPFVCYSEEIFPGPETFKPERWIDDPSLDKWLVSFSKGPRMCLGINLAWMELRLAYTHFIRRFDWKFNALSTKKLNFIDIFTPFYVGDHILADVTPAVD